MVLCREEGRQYLLFLLGEKRKRRGEKRKRREEKRLGRDLDSGRALRQSWEPGSFSWPAHFGSFSSQYGENAILFFLSKQAKML